MSTTHGFAPADQLSLLSLVEDSSGPRMTTAATARAGLDPADKEERRYRRLLSRKERLGDLSGQAACYIRLGDIFLSRGDSEQAGEMYRKSLKLARAASSASKGIERSELL
jgi:hypothetical protein